jgi:arylsulfatase A-like enzyme/Tfp pilus assembly protein PilF
MKKTEGSFMRKKHLYGFIVVLLIFLILSYYILYPSIKRNIDKKRLKKANVILITIDTLRASYVSAYGIGKANTPNMDKLAEEGALFEHCISQTPLTLPSHTTILSGTYPMYHNVRDNGGFIVPEKLTLISEILKRKGFKTAAFIAAYVLHSKWGLNQGFDLYQDNFDMTKYKVISLGKIQKRADEVFAEAKNWISQNRKNKFFTWIHLYDPHTPYSPPSPYKERFIDKPYRGEVEYTDYQLGLFIDFLKQENLFDNTLIIITADHGESLGQYHEKTHGFFIYQPTVWVPLIIKAPIVFPRKRIKVLVESVDIVPTILESLEIDKNKNIQGKSLLPLLFGEGDKRRYNIAYTETYYPRFHYGWSELKAIYYGTYKYILSPKEELYELDGKNSEGKNILLYKSKIRKRMKRRLLKFVKEKSKNSLSVIENRSLSREEIKKLAALGYISTVVDTKNKKKLADPKDKIHVYNNLLKIKKLMGEGKNDEAIILIKEIISKEPVITDAYMILGNLYYRKKNYKAAMNSFYNVLKRKPDYNFAMINIVNCLIGLRDLKTAVITVKKFLKQFPEDYALYSVLGKIYLMQTDYDKALENFLKVLEINSQNGETMNKIGEIYIIKGKFDKAEKYLKEARKIIPTLKGVYYNLAQIEEKRKALEKAIEYYKIEIKNNPNNYKACYNLAEDLREIGEFDKAIKYYERSMEINPEFNIPYFMIAKYLFNKKEKIKKAIALCEKGVKIKPYNKYTVFGYYLLSDIYSFINDKKKSDEYYEKGNKIFKKIKE